MSKSLRMPARLQLQFTMMNYQKLFARLLKAFLMLKLEDLLTYALLEEVVLLKFHLVRISKKNMYTISIMS